MSPGWEPRWKQEGEEKLLPGLGRAKGQAGLCDTETGSAGQVLLTAWAPSCTPEG